jgi:hypothetical protein
VQLIWSPFYCFSEHLAILQRTATTVQLLQHGAQTVGRTQLIDSGMRWSAGPAPSVLRQHAQLATAENLTTLSILTASFSRILQIRASVLHREVSCLAFKRPCLKFQKLSANLSLDLIYHLKC